MKVLGISGSPRRNSTTDQLVRETLAGVEGCETEFISLAGTTISPCLACVGCVKDNTCVVKDDMAALRQKIVDADAYVIGAPNYYNTLNSMTHVFMERWYQFRHREGKAVAGKIGAAVGVGGGKPQAAADAIRAFFQYNQIECVGDVTAQGPVCCFTCGYGETCKVGGIHLFFGPGTKITEDITPALSKQPDKIAEAHRLGKLLSDRLHSFATAT